MVKKIFLGCLALCLVLSMVGCRSAVDTPKSPSATVGATKPNSPVVGEGNTSRPTTDENGDPVPGGSGDSNPGGTDAPGETLRKDDFVRVLDYIPDAVQNLRYASTNNFTGKVIYNFRDAYLRYGTVQKLMDVAAELEKQGYGLLIWDGYRPVSAQRELFVTFPDPDYVSPPGVGEQTHCRGKAVDLTLYRLDNGAELLMPSEFDDFTAIADRDYSDVSAEAAANAMLLQTVMERHGFTGYSKEWWHFNDTDEYPVEENFDPATLG